MTDRQLISTGTIWEEQVGYSRAVRVGNQIFVTGTIAADKDGNVVTMTSTIEGPFGSQLMAAGFFLNNELTDFTFAPMKDGKPVANAVKGGKRPVSSMSPTIVFDSQGRPVLALGSAGGKRIIMHVAKTLIGYLDWGYPLEEAIAQLRVGPILGEPG